MPKHEPSDSPKETSGHESSIPKKEKVNLFSKRDGKSWIWRILAVVSVFLVWLFFGGSLSTTGIILGGLLVGGGGVLIWFSYMYGGDT